MRAAETVDMAGGDVVRIMTSGAPAYQHLPSLSPAPAPDTADTRLPIAPRVLGDSTAEPEL